MKIKKKMLSVWSWSHRERVNSKRLWRPTTNNFISFLSFYLLSSLPPPVLLPFTLIFDPFLFLFQFLSLFFSFFLLSTVLSLLSSPSLSFYFQEWENTGNVTEQCLRSLSFMKRWNLKRHEPQLFPSNRYQSLSSHSNLNTLTKQF